MARLVLVIYILCLHVWVMAVLNIHVQVRTDSIRSCNFIVCLSVAGWASVGHTPSVARGVQKVSPSIPAMVSLLFGVLALTIAA